MKLIKAFTVISVAPAATAIAISASSRFGPANCVSLSRSSAGTCVIHTDCAGQDLSKFDVSFDCVAKSGRQTHSLGVGSFDQKEEYDTDLKCDQCEPPQSVMGHPLVKRVTAASTGVSLAVVNREVKKQSKQIPDQIPDLPNKLDDVLPPTEPKVEWYGPDNCVGVWRDDKSGTCVMQTDCSEDTQIDVYEFGLLCADQWDEMTRHIFGLGSFGHKETFNTLIKCNECLALDEYQNGNKGAAKLTKMVGEMSDALKNISEQVTKLNGAVFAGPSPGPAPAAAPAQAPKKPAKFLLSKQTTMQQKPKVEQPAPQEQAIPNAFRPIAAQQIAEVVVKDNAKSIAKAGTEAAVEHVKLKASLAKQIGQSVLPPADVVVEHDKQKKGSQEQDEVIVDEDDEEFDHSKAEDDDED